MNLEEPTAVAKDARMPPEIAGYRLISRLGAGAMGEVFKGQNAAGVVRAIKLVRRAALNRAPGMQDRFNREAMVSANIDHPAVVKVHDLGEIEHGLYMVMDYVDGTSLEQRIAAGPVPVTLALDIAAQAAEALHAAHETSVVHRDIKPANMLLDRATGQVRLLDFGIARLVGDNQGLTKEGQLVGTPRYMSPEQVRGHAKDSDHRTDIWSLGVVLYEMLTGRPPFEGENMFKLMDAITAVEPPAPSRLRGEVPSAVDRVVRKALAKDAAMRHGSASALAAELRQLLAGLSGRPQGDAGRRETAPPRSDTGSARRPGRGAGERARSGIDRSDAPKRFSEGPPALAIAACVAVAAIVLGILVARSGDPGTSTELAKASPPPPKPTPPVTQPPEPSRPDAIATELERLAALALPTEPSELARRIDSWRKLARMAGSGPYDERIAAEQLAAESALERLAQAEFDRRRSSTELLIESRQFDAALARWDDFDPALATATWRERIAEERRTIELARRAAAEPPTPTPTPTPTPPATTGLMLAMPAGWTAASKGDGIEALHLDGTPWISAENVLTLVCAEGVEHAVGMLLHREASGLRRSLAEVYVVFDLMLVKGKMEIRVLHPIDNREVPVLNLGLDPTASPWMSLGRWYRMHFLYRDGTLTYGAEGVRVFDPVSGIKAEEGALMFIARTGTELRVRPVSYFHGRIGKPLGQ